MSKSKIREEDFMSELEAATRLRPSSASVILLFTITALVSGFVLWASFARVEEITRGEGQVVPSQQIQVVQSLEGGVLQDILVKQGEIVSRGDILLRISDVQFASEERGTEAQFLGLMAKKSRLDAEAAGLTFEMPEDISEKIPQISANEMALYRSRQEELQNIHDILDQRIEKAQADLAEVNAQISRLSESRGLLSQELQITRQMVQRRAVPKLDEIRLNRELSDISGQINAETQRRTALQAELNAARKEREGQDAKFRSQALSELNEVETQIKRLEESLRSIGDRVSRTEIRSPVDGIVNNIALSTVGGVVEPAQRLVEIVPVDDELKIIARVSPSDVAFLRPDLPAKVKITAYDSQRYGALDGRLTRIGANSVSDGEGGVFFEIEVVTEKNFMGTEDNPLPITPGMVAQVEVITGKRSIMAYLLKPLLRARDMALTER
ncbi:MAG: HlyD family type I secretion periplasmic adaptor subunit [Alphaproteobacteria bacterium]